MRGCHTTNVSYNRLSISEILTDMELEKMISHLIGLYVNTLEIDFDLVSKITSCTQCFYTQEAGDSDNAESFVTFSKNTHI